MASLSRKWHASPLIHKAHQEEEIRREMGKGLLLGISRMSTFVGVHFNLALESDILEKKVN